MTMTRQEAEVLRADAIRKANNLDIAGMIDYLLLHDATTVADTLNERDEVVGTIKGRPLPRSGYVMKRSYKDGVFTRLVYSADNSTEYVFFMVGPDIRSFREGSWVRVLQSEWEALHKRLESPGVLEIVRAFSPLEE